MKDRIKRNPWLFFSWALLVVITIYWAARNLMVTSLQHFSFEFGSTMMAESNGCHSAIARAQSFHENFCCCHVNCQMLLRVTFFCYVLVFTLQTDFSVLILISKTIVLGLTLTARKNTCQLFLSHMLEIFTSS